jgi:hypothetical protein
MSDGDWYRNATWDSRIEVEFFAKLSRARSQRDQYLVIQALSLEESMPEVTLRLVDTYFETRKEDFHDVQALLARANAYQTKGEIGSAIVAYKAVLEREAEFPKHKTTTGLALPYFIACQRLTEEYEYALTVLAQEFESLIFPKDYFLWHASQALIFADSGEKTNGAEHAKMAIEAAKIRRSGFRYHQNIGLVGKRHDVVIEKLVRIAKEKC